jgi:sigma-B regulation protein RsbU (phosphoserine phosphatase)
MFQVNPETLTGLQRSPVTFPTLIIALFLSAYILWRRYRSRRRLVARVAELEILSAAGRAIVASELNISALCKLVAQQAGAFIDTKNFHIGLYDNQLYHVHYWTVAGQSQDLPQPIQLDGHTDALSYIRENKESLLINEYSPNRSIISISSILTPFELPKSAVYVPLISGAQAIGAIGAFSDQPNQFGERELGQLTILANQAAAAIANARIFHQERTRAAQLELVSRIAGQITAISDLDELLRQVVSLTQETFGFSSVNIFGINPDSGEVFNQASSLTELKPGMVRLAPGLGLIGSSVETRSTVLSNNTLEDDRFVDESISEKTHSEIVIPLLVDRELMGVLDVQSEQIAAFSDQDQSVLEALAAQIAVAILKARQFTAQREQAWIATAQLQVAKAIGQSNDLDSLAESVVRLTAMLLGAEHCFLLAWDGEIDSYLVLADYGVGDDQPRDFKTRAITLGEWPVLDAAHVARELYISQKPISSLLLSDESDSKFATREMEEWLMPLIVKDQLLGMMVIGVVHSAGDKKFSPSARREIVRNISRQTAQGLDSIELQQALQEEAWVNTALLQVAEAVNRLTDLDEILYSIVRLVPMLVGAENCVVLIWDEERKRYRAGPSHGISEMGYGLLESFEIDLSEFPLLERQDVERIGPEAAYYTFSLPEWMITVMDSSTAQIFPLHARGRLVGVLVVGPTSSGRALSGRRLNILTGIAQQAAIAVVNDQLYQESAERSRIEQELSVALSIQSSLIPSENPDIPGCAVAGYWQAARQVSGDFYDYMRFRDGRWGIAIADVADKGIPAALFMALSRTILRTVAFNRKNPAEVLIRTNEIIYNDTTSDHFVTVFYALWNPEDQSFHYANGGHNPPVLITAGGETNLLSSDGIALGVLRDISISEKSIKLNKGDCIVFYTDGVTEAMNEDFDEFGLERLIMVTQDARSGTAEEIVSAIHSAIDDHAGSTPQFDDTTMVVLKR